MRCGARRRQAAWQRDKFQCETFANPPLIVFVLERPENRGTNISVPRPVISDQSILTALSSVFHTPHSSGMPTKAQNKAALASSPPNPMPYDPEGPDAPTLALAACSLATSASLMCHFRSTGLIR